MTTNTTPLELFRSLPATRLRREISYVEDKIAKLAERKSQKLHDDYSEFMAPTLAEMRQALSEKES